MLEYTTPHTPQFNVFVESIFVFINKRALDVLLNAKWNDIAQKILWAEAVHTCERVRNSMETIRSTKIPFEIFYGEKLKIIGLLSEFLRITYITNRENIKIHMKDKTYKSIMVGYAENHTRGTYKL